MASECVVLLPGFGRSSLSLNKISTHLEEQGYRTLALDYASRSFHIFQLAEQFALPEIKKCMNEYKKIHFVGFSMGGIITRYILEHHRPKNLGRVVLIATPNGGVEVVNKLGKYIWFQTLFGPAMQEVAQGSPFLERLPKKIDYETGIISGNFSVNPFTSLFLINGEDDGSVSVESTKIDGMKDHLVTNSTHTMLLFNKEVIKAVSNFIQNGSF